MKTSTLYIENPSPKLLSIVRAMQADKDKAEKDMLLKGSMYFNKKLFVKELEQDVFFSADNGNNYLIEFSLVNNFEELPIPLINVRLALIGKNISTISFKSLIQISNIIANYISINNVILYYYCDNKDINKRNADILPQQYRSMLFESLFKRSRRNNLVSKTTVIKDNDNVFHYICLISRLENEPQFDVISNEIGSIK